MDIINLIRSVRCREPIWNRQHPQYKDREYSMFLWSQVASEVGVDVETARYKWRGLRDTFRVQLRKLNQPLSKKPKSQSPLKWEYFDEMVFVKDQIYIDVNRKKYYGKDKLPEQSYLYKDDDLDIKVEDEDTNDESAEADNTEETEEYQGPADFCITEVTEDVDGCLEFNHDANEIEDNNSRISEEDGSFFDRPQSNQILQKKLRSLQDDNYCFLMSVLPQLKSLPTKQKLYVRIKIQEMLLAEVLNLESQE